MDQAAIIEDQGAVRLGEVGFSVAVPQLRMFYVGVQSCGAWCGYGAYLVLAEDEEDAKGKVKEKDFADWADARLTFKVVDIVNTLTAGGLVHELDEIDVIG